MRELPRHGPQAERHRNLHRGVEGADRGAEELEVLRQKRLELRQHQPAWFAPSLQGTVQVRGFYPRSSGEVAHAGKPTMAPQFVAYGSRLRDFLLLYSFQAGYRNSHLGAG